MANSHIPKHGVSSQGCDGREWPRHCVRGVTFLLEIRLFLAFFVLSLHSASGQIIFSNTGMAVRISGHYSDIFSNGAPPETNNYSFIAIAADNRWKISVTNLNKPKEWSIMHCDGTNIFTLGTDSVNAYKMHGYVFPGGFYVPEAALNSVKMFFPWMVFHLTPQMIRDLESKGVKDIPHPWGGRHTLRDYGFNWKISSFQDYEIIQRIEVVRDSALDLKADEDELRRPTVNYAFQYSTRQHRLDMLSSRKEIPDGFVRAAYECENLYKTNGWITPLRAKFAQYAPTFQPSNPIRLVFEMALQVEAINVLGDTEISEITTPAKSPVFDYRYQATNSRTKFNYATYTLDAGNSFLSASDPNLLAQANDWLKHGPSYQSVQAKRSKILFGMLTVTIVTSGLLVFWLKKTKKQNK